MKVAIYCRLSEEDQGKLSQNDDSASIQNQKAMLIQYASSNGWIVYDIYSDDDYAGSDRTRPEFHRLIMDARDRKFDIVLCKTQSRFTRELELVEKYIHGLFPRLGIRFISVVDSADTDNKGNKKARQINGLVNEWFLEELSDNIRAVLTSRREQGYHIGSFAPYGYQKDPNLKGHLIIDPEAAAVVREIFWLYAAGSGKQAIAQTLNDRGVPNPTEYKRLHGMLRNKRKQSGTLWGYFTISNILQSEVYIGNMIQGKTGVVSYKNHRKVAYPQEQWFVVKGTHDPIISQELWDKVQNLISEKATTNPKATEGKFAGKVRCMHCGARMQSIKSGEKRGFKCVTHTLSHDSCVGASISLRKLERIVAAELFVLSEELLDCDVLEQEIDPFPDLKVQKANTQFLIASTGGKIQKSQASMRTLYMNKVKGSIKEAEYLDLLLDVTDEKVSYEKELEELTQQLAQINQTLCQNANRKELVQRYVGTRELSKEMVSVLIDSVFVGKRDPITRQTPVEIQWNF